MTRLLSSDKGQRTACLHAKTAYASESVARMYFYSPHCISQTLVALQRHTEANLFVITHMRFWLGTGLMLESGGSQNRE